MNYKKLALIGVGVLTLFVSTLMPLFASSSVSADPTPGGYSAVYKWVDAQTIQDSNGITYIFNKVSKTGLGLFVATTRPGISCTLPSNSDHVEQIEMPTYTYNSQTKQRKQTGVTYISYDYDEFAIYNGANIVALNMGDVSDKWYPSGKINDFYLNQSNAPFGTVVTFSNPPAGDPSGLCGSNKPVPLQTQDLGNATILYDWFDSRTIVSLKAAGGKTYKNNDPTHPNRYTQTGGVCF